MFKFVYFFYFYLIFSLFSQDNESFFSYDKKEELTEDYFEAINSSNYKKLDYLIEEMKDNQINIDIENEDYDSSLIVAVHNTDMKMIKYLLKKGAPVNRVSDDNQNVLMHGSYGGDMDIVKYLSQSKINITNADNSNHNPLDYAIYGGNVDTVAYLLNRYKNLSLNQKSSRKILKLALMGGNLKMLKYLISKGIDINFLSENNEAFMTTIKGTYEKPIPYLENKNRNIENYIEILDFLLTKGFSVRGKNEEGETPLMIAAKGNSKGLVEYLIKKGAQVKEKVSFLFFLENSVLSYVGNNRIYFYLENYIYKIDNFFYFVKNRKLNRVINILKYRGIDINTLDENGRTALMISAEEGHPNITEYLLQNGADKKLKDKENKTAFDYANKKKLSPKILKLLKF